MSTFRIVYLILLALSAIAGAYSGYRWEPVRHGGHIVAAIEGHSWFSDVGLGLCCRLGQAVKF
jgi:hypothetical protein